MTPSVAAHRLSAARVLTAVCGAAMAVFGAWSLLAPSSFARFTAFPPANEHLLHDAGAFQLGLAASLLVAALVRADGLTVALTGFVVADAIHVVNHVTDLHLGGHEWDPVVLGALGALAVIALLLRPRPIRSGDLSPRRGPA